MILSGVAIGGGAVLGTGAVATVLAHSEDQRE
jgi:acetyltransferase-like isoleucine patch superfamily enzyme